MRLILHRIGLITLFVINFIFSVKSQEDWKLEKDKDGVKVYTRSSDKSSFKEYRGHIRLQQSIHAFFAVMQDIKNLPEWAYSLKSAELLKNTGESLLIYYTEVSIPFPFSNRDGIYQNKFIWHSDSSLLIIEISLLPDYISQKDKLVRIPWGEGFWRVKVISENLIDVTFQMIIDPGGELPSWLINMFIVDTPYTTLVNLREIIMREKYQNRRFSFLE